MGVPNNGTKQYRAEGDAVSLHNTPDDYTYDDAPEIDLLPPSYDDSQGESANDSSAGPSSHHHGGARFGRHDHNTAVAQKMGKPQVKKTYPFVDPRCNTDPAYLEHTIRDFACQAPYPLVYIMGTHHETVRRGDKKDRRQIVDFRIVIDLQKYLKRNFDPSDHSLMRLSTIENGQKAYRGSLTQQRAPGFKQDIEVGAPKPELKEWCHRFCASSAFSRVFRLQRTVTGFDESYTRSRLEGLIRSTNYRGNINITFPVENENIDIYTSSRINQWRLNPWVRWTFYLSFLWIFSWPYLFFATKRYAVVKAEWPFSVKDIHGRKVYTTMSEEQWIEKWQTGIRRLVLDRYQGEVSEAIMQGVTARSHDPPMPHSFRLHAGPTNSIGMSAQAIQIAIASASAMTRGVDANEEGWGHEY